MPSGAQVVAAARLYIDVPWRHQGADARGMDCAGLLLAVAGDLGLPRPQALAYDRLPDLRLIDTLLADYCERVAAWSEGDVLRLTVAGRAQHLGIVGARDYGYTLIHGYATAARVCEHRLDARWMRRIHSAWRIRGVH